MHYNSHPPVHGEAKYTTKLATCNFIFYCCSKTAFVFLESTLCPTHVHAGPYASGVASLVITTKWKVAVFYPTLLFPCITLH